MTAVAKPAPKKKEIAFTVNTAYCRSELETVQHVIEKMNLQEVSVGGNLFWFGLALMDKDVKIMSKKKCFFNRYPGTEYIARKKVFCMIGNRMRRTFPKIFNFSPISFLIPEESQTLESYMGLHPNFTFIGKPSCGKGGEGIFLIDKFSKIPQKSYVKNNDLLV